MITHFHTQNNYNIKDDHNLLAIPQNVILTTQLQNYKNPHNTTKKGDVQRTPSKVKIPRITRLFHFVPERVKMTTNHFEL